MKKYIISLVAFMTVMGTQMSYAQTQDDNKQQTETTKDGKDKKDRPRRGHGPGFGGPGGPMMIKATDGCTCATCEKLREMEKKMEEMRKKMQEQGGQDGMMPPPDFNGDGQN